MQYIAIIPSRYASTRIPAKALHSLCGKPMFWHVYHRAKACTLFTNVYIATDDERIATEAEYHNIPVIMTSSELTSGTDRVYQAGKQLNVSEDTILVNIQGDEPLLHPHMLYQLLQIFQEEPSTQVATLYTDIENREIENPARVKIVANAHDNALYFSRSVIPYHRNSVELPYKAHIGIYAYTYNALERFVHCPPSLLEKAESLEQLRFFELNIPIRIVYTEHQVHSVDEPHDIPIVEQKLQQDPFWIEYIHNQ